MAAPWLITVLLLAISFALATLIEPVQQRWGDRRLQTGNVLEIVMGDARRMFANHFFEKADVYFHGGYYPSLFDRAFKAKGAGQGAESETDHAKHQDHETEHEKEMDFLGKPQDWIDKLGRHFFASEHSHLSKPQDAGELLPWLRLSAELDPHHIETYTVTSFWLTTQLQKVDEAITFLREGWRENPDSYGILLELGRVYYTYKHDIVRARNVWELGLRKWEAQEPQKKEPDTFGLEQLLAHLADLEEKDGRMVECVAYLERLQKISPTPDVIQKQIVERKAKLGVTPR
jgi:hypothetical protein